MNSFSNMLAHVLAVVGYASVHREHEFIIIGIYWCPRLVFGRGHLVQFDRVVLQHAYHQRCIWRFRWLFVWCTIIKFANPLFDITNPIPVNSLQCFANDFVFPRRPDNNELCILYITDSLSLRGTQTCMSWCHPGDEHVYIVILDVIQVMTNSASNVLLLD